MTDHAGKSTEATCSLCGQTWPRDPRLEVACPTCQAGVGHRCKRASGHPIMGGGWHTPREQRAIEEGFMSKECPALHRATTAIVPDPQPTPCEPWDNQESLFT